MSTTVWTTLITAVATVTAALGAVWIKGHYDDRTQVRRGPDKAGTCLGTARWGGSGERDGEEYARNRRHYALQSMNRLKPGGYGPGAARPDVCRSGGNSGGAVLRWPGEATVKVCGVAVAGPLGQSRAPTPTSESR